MQDQRLGVVEQNLARHTPEGTERTLHAIEPAVLLLMTIGPDMQAARVTQRRHKQKHFHRHAIDLHSTLAEVDLQLFTGLRLEPNRRSCRGNQLTPQWSNRAFHSPQADGDVLLPSQLLPYHIGIPGMLAKTLAQPLV